jgi:hypothetical protein
MKLQDGTSRRKTDTQLTSIEIWITDLLMFLRRIEAQDMEESEWGQKWWPPKYAPPEEIFQIYVYHHAYAGRIQVVH